MKRKRLFLNDEELNIILDGLEDTKERIKKGKAKPISIRYTYLMKRIRDKVNIQLMADR